MGTFRFLSLIRRTLTSILIAHPQLDVVATFGTYDVEDIDATNRRRGQHAPEAGTARIAL